MNPDREGMRPKQGSSDFARGDNQSSGAGFHTTKGVWNESHSPERDRAERGEAPPEEPMSDKEGGRRGGASGGKLRSWVRPAGK